MQISAYCIFMLNIFHPWIPIICLCSASWNCQSSVSFVKIHCRLFIIVCIFKFESRPVNSRVVLTSSSHFCPFTRRIIFTLLKSFRPTMWGGNDYRGVTLGLWFIWKIYSVLHDVTICYFLKESCIVSRRKIHLMSPKHCAIVKLAPNVIMLICQHSRKLKYIKLGPKEISR